MGKKDLYLFEISKLKSRKDEQNDLLSVLENLKSGLVTNLINGSTLMMEPPHIIVSSNHLLKYEVLSKDRWDVYEITNFRKLIKCSIKSEPNIRKLLSTVLIMLGGPIITILLD